MKKSAKIWIAGGSLLAIGVLVWIIGMFLIDWNFFSLDTTKYTAKSYACQASVEKVTVDVDSFPVEIKAGDSVAIDYYDTDDSAVEVQEDSGTLEVREKYKYRPFRSGIFGGIRRHLHKYVLTTVSGVSYEFTGSNTDVTVSGVDTDEFTVDASNCDIHFIDCNISKLVITSSNVDVELKDCDIGAVEIDGSNTDCDIYGGAIGAMSVDASNIDIEVHSATVTTLDIDGSNVDCELEAIRIDRLKISASNLDADIRIKGLAEEYTVRTSGRDMPHDRVGATDKLIELSGTNNDVELSFV